MFRISTYINTVSATPPAPPKKQLQNREMWNPKLERSTVSLGYCYKREVIHPQFLLVYIQFMKLRNCHGNLKMETTI